MLSLVYSILSVCQAPRFTEFAKIFKSLWRKELGQAGRGP